MINKSDLRVPRFAQDGNVGGMEIKYDKHIMDGLTVASIRFTVG